MDTVLLILIVISVVLVIMAFRVRNKQKPAGETSLLENEPSSSPDEQDEDFEWEKVRLPRRIEADSIDGVIGMLIWVLPVFLSNALGGTISELIARFSVVGMVAGLLYVIFRDWAGRGTSFGKRLLGLSIIDLEKQEAVNGAKVWSRNLVDVVPFLNAIDFIAACIDIRGQKFMDKRLNTQLVFGAIADE